jgi:hypothetical protein
MERRDSNTLDESDFTNAYRLFLSSRRKDWVREIIAGLVILIGAGLVGYGTNLVANGVHLTPGIALIMGSLLIGIFGFLFQHYPFRPR